MKNILNYLAVLSGAALFVSSHLAAESVSTNPVGYTTLTVAAGTGTARTFTTLALPLYQPASSVDGKNTGVIDSIAADSLTISDAGWSAGALSDPAAPFVIRITSGAAEGRNLLISTSTANTADTLTIDLTQSGISDLTELGLVSGVDTFELIDCDTLSSLFGEPVAGGVIGSDDFAAADNIWLFTNGAWSKYYYDTSLGYWAKFSRGTPDASNQVLLPDVGILYSRIADESSSFLVTGSVPTTARQITVNQAGLTVVGASWPVNMTLAEANFEQISEWQSSVDASAADKVYIMSDGSWQRYYHDGTNWLKNARGTPISDDVDISSGSAVLLLKAAAAADNAVLSQVLPYTL